MTTPSARVSPGLGSPSAPPSASVAGLLDLAWPTPRARSSRTAARPIFSGRMLKAPSAMTDRVRVDAGWRCRRTRPRTTWRAARTARRAWPTCSIRPSLNTAIRSLIVSASSWSWVTKQKVMPTSRWICLSSICISLAQLEVEGAERLVEQQHLGPVDQRPGERDPLPLAAGELGRPAVAVPAEPDGLQGLPARARDARPGGPSSPSGRTRRWRARPCAGTARSPGRRC